MARFKKLERKQMDSKNYRIDMESVATFSVIEDFIQLYKFTQFINLSQVFGLGSQIYLKQGQGNDNPRIIDAVFLFKQGIKPEWEDPNHQKGGII